MKKIKTIFFDIGNVLVSFDFTPAIRRTAARSPYSVEEISGRAFKNPLFRDYERGRVTTDKFFQHAKELFQFDGTIGELELAWSEVFTPIEEHLLLVRSLSQHYPLALISNTNESHMRHLARQHDFFTFFQEKIYSHEVGHAKPSAEIYKTALKRMKAAPETSLFIDDLEENVLAPSQMGWQTIHLKSGDSLQNALRRYKLQGI